MAAEAMLPRHLTAGACAAILAAFALTRVEAQRPDDLISRQIVAEVVGVLDGDTVDVLIPSGRRLRVRVHGVDAPERGEPFSQQALNFTRVFMFAKRVTVIGRDVDAYDRLVARVVVDGADASPALLSAGLACHFRRYSDDPILEAAEQAARTARRGFWAPGAQQPACVAREAKAQQTTSPSVPAIGFVGNVNSRVFHSPACPNANCKNCTRRFGTRGEAVAAGFRPAGDCLR
jgi:endonuclease YncB( thermonuclease family)